MTTQPLSIYSNINWPDADRDTLKAAVQTLGHQIVYAESATPRSPAAIGFVKSDSPPPDQFDIAFGQPDVGWLLRSQRLRWIQITSAGYTRYDRDDLRTHCRSRQIQFTNASSILADPCAQHVLSFMLAATRQLHPFADAQHAREWIADRQRGAIRILDGDEVLIVGFGSIARRLVELLQPFHCNIVGVRQTPRGDEPVPTRSIADLDSLLPTADHIVNLLPAAESTKRLFDATRFRLMKRGAIFYNIGRGSTVDQTALRDVLASGHLAGAFVDVTSPEPLSADDPLWTTPRLHLTPHIGGAMQDAPRRQTDHFIANLRRFANGEPLIDRVF